MERALRILLVFEQYSIKVQIEKLLISWGMDVEGATSDMGVNNKVVSFFPDLVITQFKASRINGPNVFRKLATSKIVKKVIPCILVVDNVNDERKCRQAGINEFLMRPFSAKQLGILVKSLTGSKKDISEFVPEKKATDTTKSSDNDIMIISGLNYEREEESAVSFIKGLRDEQEREDARVIKGNYDNKDKGITIVSGEKEDKASLKHIKGEKCILDGETELHHFKGQRSDGDSGIKTIKGERQRGDGETDIKTFKGERQDAGDGGLKTIKGERQRGDGETDIRTFKGKEQDAGDGGLKTIKGERQRGEGETDIRTFKGKEQDAGDGGLKTIKGERQRGEGETDIRTFKGKGQETGDGGLKNIKGERQRGEGETDLRMFKGKEQEAGDGGLKNIKGERQRGEGETDLRMFKGKEQEAGDGGLKTIKGERQRGEGETDLKNFKGERHRSEEETDLHHFQGKTDSKGNKIKIFDGEEDQSGDGSLLITDREKGREINDRRGPDEQEDDGPGYKFFKGEEGAGKRFNHSGSTAEDAEDDVEFQISIEEDLGPVEGFIDDEDEEDEFLSVEELPGEGDEFEIGESDDEIEFSLRDPGSRRHPLSDLDDEDMSFQTRSMTREEREEYLRIKQERAALGGDVDFQLGGETNDNDGSAWYEEEHPGESLTNEMLFDEEVTGIHGFAPGAGEESSPEELPGKGEELKEDAIEDFVISDDGEGEDVLVGVEPFDEDIETDEISGFEEEDESDYLDEASLQDEEDDYDFSFSEDRPAERESRIIDPTLGKKKKEEREGRILLTGNKKKQERDGEIFMTGQEGTSGDKRTVVVDGEQVPEEEYEFHVSDESAADSAEPKIIDPFDPATRKSKNVILTDDEAGKLTVSHWRRGKIGKIKRQQKAPADVKLAKEKAEFLARLIKSGTEED